MLHRSVLVTFCLICISYSSKAQSYISGYVKDGIFGDPLPFCVIKIDNGKEILADSKGQFEIRSEKTIQSLEFRAPFHNSLRYPVKSDSLSLEIRLIAYTIFLPIKNNDTSATGLIYRWQSSSYGKDLKHSKYLSYGKSSSSILKSTDIRRFKTNFNKFLSLTGKRLNSYSKEHYLFYTSSQQKIEYKNRFSREETISSSKNIGIKNVVEFSGEKEPFEVSIYRDYWRIGNSYYPNPLAGDFEKRFLFQVYDSLNLNGSRIYIISFYPKINKKAQKLRGFIYLDADKNDILSIWAEKAIDTDSKIRISFDYRDFKEFRVPNSGYLVQNLSGIESYSTQLKLESFNTYSNYLTDTRLSDKYYDEVIKEFPEENIENQQLKEEDSLIENTTEFYRRNPQLQSFYKAITFGRKLYKGRIPLGKVNIEMDQLIGFNNHEGLRLGLGISTDESLWKRNHSNIYSAYGFGDKRFKFGIRNRYFLDQSFWHWIEFSARRDVFESGSSEFDQVEKLMFKSEALRRYGISIMDNEAVIESSLNLHLMKYLQGRVKYKYSQLQPTYDYEFDSIQDNRYNYGEISYMLRFAPGEERIRLGSKLIIRENPYPVFFINWTLGRPAIGNDFSYDKLEMMLKYQKRILGFGLSSLRLQAGFLNRSLPYHKMYVARGGLRNFSVVFHNTFETMLYNEFLSDRYFYLFYSHNFGAFYIPFLNHFSSLEMQHNFGIGDLKSPERHSSIDFDIMNKGYLESGLFMNDIIILNASGLRTGLGAGFFYRYGAYQNPGFGRNFVFKVSLNLDL